MIVQRQKLFIEKKLSELSNLTGGLKQVRVILLWHWKPYMNAVMIEVNNRAVGCGIRNGNQLQLGFADDAVLLGDEERELQSLVNESSTEWERCETPNLKVYNIRMFEEETER